MKDVLLAIVLSAACVCAQDDADRVTIPFPASGQPRKLQVNLLNGSITVRGTQGNDAIVEGHGGGRGRANESGADGLRRLEPRGSGLRIDQNENTIRISGGNQRSEVTVQIPRETSVVVKTVSGGQIVVENVSGDIEANNINGGVSLTNVAGSVVAHSLNGKVLVSMDRVTPGKPMSFSTLNGDIDVTLPADTKANLRMKTDNGDMFTDFDVKMDPQTSQQPPAESSGGKRRIQFDRGVAGSINGGGAEMRFTTLNGRIYIRKKK